MRNISTDMIVYCKEFSDYYDYHSAYDKSDIKYVRKREKIDTPQISKLRLPNSMFFYSYSKETYVNIKLLVICDKVYYTVHTDKKIIITSDKNEFISITKLFFDLWFLKTLKSEVDIDEVISMMKKIQYEYQTPIVVVVSGKYTGSISVEINSRLMDYGIHKVIDSFEMHQMIETFFANDLVREKNPPVIIDDRYKISAHGFDKQSFRKRKTKTV